MKDWIWRLRHRRSRRETMAFVFGMEVGRMLTPEQAVSLKTRVEDLY